MAPASAVASPMASSSSSSSAADASAAAAPDPAAAAAPSTWWESITLARGRIDALAAILPLDLTAVADSDRPAAVLLSSPVAYAAVSAAIAADGSGSSHDAVCRWLYETLQSPDADTRLCALAFAPLLAGIYLSRAVATFSLSSPSPSLAGFEAVLVALYRLEFDARGGRPILVHVPDLSHPSLYHSPRPSLQRAPSPPHQNPIVGVMSPPLEPERDVKSTKRALIVGVALDSYYKKISLMPTQSKIDLCEFASSWAGQDCPCRHELDNVGITDDVSEEMNRVRIHDDPNGHCLEEETKNKRGTRVPLPWELMQPMLRILGHCLLAPLNPQEVRDAASEAVRCVYARAMHDLLPQGILAARSLIRLDNNARITSKEITTTLSLGGIVSNPNTSSKPRKPEVLLVSK